MILILEQTMVVSIVRHVIVVMAIVAGQKEREGLALHVKKIVYAGYALGNGRQTFLIGNGSKEAVILISSGLPHIVTLQKASPAADLFMALDATKQLGVQIMMVFLINATVRLQ